MTKKTLEIEVNDKKDGSLSHILKEEDITGKVKIAVYDEKGNFKGYKIDSFWNTLPDRFKPHFLRGVESTYLKNLETALNDPEQGADYQKEYTSGSKISVKSIETNKELMVYKIHRNEKGEYTLKKLN